MSQIQIPSTEDVIGPSGSIICGQMGGATGLSRKTWHTELFKDLFQKEIQRQVGGNRKIKVEKKITWAFLIEDLKC